jgi:thiamine biosynthesis lipoprotein
MASLRAAPSPGYGLGTGLRVTDPGRAVEVTRLEFECLGMACRLLALSPAPGRLEAGARWARSVERRLSMRDGSSELSRLHAAAGRWVPVSPELESLLRAALWAYEASGGLVHVGAAVPVDDGAGRPAPPLSAVLEVARRRAWLAPGARIALAGLARSWMADSLGGWLGENAFADLGGSVCACGPGPEGAGWPVDMTGETVMVIDAGVATSGIPGWEVVDPRTGRPAASDLRQVSVLAPTAIEAEVLARTALLVGSRRAPAVLADRALGWAFREM